MHYFLVSIAVAMFGIQFLFSKKYEQNAGNGIGASFIASFISGLIGVICLTIINGIQFSVTPFTLLMATLVAFNSIAYTFCALKALKRINLSLYSLFAMLGGMILPFFQGIIFYNEPITVAKIVCVVFIIVALALGISKSEAKGGTIYYIGVFMLNGMSGVLAKIFQSSALPKTSNAMYSILCSAILCLLSGTIIIILALISKAKKNEEQPLIKAPNAKAILFASGGGVLNNVANFFLLISLAFIPASVQYPFITGGVMIVSTVISAIVGAKPSKKEVFAVILSFVGILALVLIPI